MAANPQLEPEVRRLDQLEQLAVPPQRAAAEGDRQAVQGGLDHRPSTARPPQADPINSAVKAILGGRASEDQRFDDMLKYINANYGAPSNYFYGIGGAWYFSLNKYRDELIDGRNDLDRRPDARGPGHQRRAVRERAALRGTADRPSRGG